MNNGLEWLKDDKENSIALIIHNHYTLDKTTFFTPENFNLQVGFVVYKNGQKVHTHTHNSFERKIYGTSEFLIIRNGRVSVQFYSLDKTFIARRELVTGDAVLFIEGWHGIDFLEDSIILEIKQGPYLGFDDKVRAADGEMNDSSK